MHKILGELVGSLADRLMQRLGERIDRVSIARSLRDVADGVERGDIVPDELLSKAKALAESLQDARAQYRDG